MQSAVEGQGIDFTRASEALLSANPSQVSSGSGAAPGVSGGEISTRTIAGADVATGPGAEALRGDQARARQNFSHVSTMRAHDQMNTMIKQLSALPGRKSVLLVTSGLLLTGDPERFRSLLEEANRADLTIYALDAKGLTEQSAPEAGNRELDRVSAVSRMQGGVGGNLDVARTKSRQMDDLHNAVRSSDAQASLRALAEGTGGFIIANSEDYRKPFGDIAAELGTHYEAIYRPGSGVYDGRLRTVDVKVANADWRVKSQAGYFAIPDVRGWSAPAPHETAALALLSGRPLPRDFEFRSGVFHFRDRQNAIVVEVPGANLSATPNPPRKAHRVHLSVLALVKSPDGQIVDWFSRDASYEIPDANLEAARGGPITYTQPLKLPAGVYKVETVVIDQETRRASARELKVEIPEARQGVSLSNIMLVDRIEPVTGEAAPGDPLVYQGQRAMPLLDAKLKAGSKAFAYFVVYGRQSSVKPSIRVEFLANGELVAKQSAELPPSDASGAIPMMVAAPAPAGECELRITAVQESASATQSVKYTVEK
jgi:VWFA-related protein